MSGLAVFGCDPGPASGLVVLAWEAPERRWPPDEVRAYQCDAASAYGLLAWLLKAYRSGYRRLAAIEEFREGNRSVRTGNAADAKVTRALVTSLGGIVLERGVRLSVRPAATVKPWCECNNNKRMEEAGLWSRDPKKASRVPKKMIDARSASQICVYESVTNGGLPDPLSCKARGL